MPPPGTYIDNQRQQVISCNILKKQGGQFLVQVTSWQDAALWSKMAACLLNRSWQASILHRVQITDTRAAAHLQVHHMQIRNTVQVSHCFFVATDCRGFICFSSFSLPPDTDVLGSLRRFVFILKCIVLSFGQVSQRVTGLFFILVQSGCSPWETRAHMKTSALMRSCVYSTTFVGRSHSAVVQGLSQCDKQNAATGYIKSPLLSLSACK